MPASFPVYRHVTVTSPIEIDDDRDGCNVGVDREGLQLLSDVVPGVLPPLPLIVSALESGCDGGGETSKREAEAWRDAAEKAATLARHGGRPPKIGHHGNDFSVTERSFLLRSPAAILFVGPRGGLSRTGPEDYEDTAEKI